MTDEVVEQEVESLKTAFKQVQADLAELTKLIGELTAQRAKEGFAEVREASEHVQEKLQKAASNAREIGQSGLSHLEKEVAEKPLASVLIAFGVGWLLGRLGSRG